MQAKKPLKSDSFEENQKQKLKIDGLYSGVTHDFPLRASVLSAVNNVLGGVVSFIGVPTPDNVSARRFLPGCGGRAGRGHH